ncbi:hypothetical protein EDI_244920 [Entamoeba dispar SAW760]|uniref:TLDc domain-containing protein n=1 Tax=Entamoeba dispar (strain ATCC PRA-260 / SAW760) TaxID=370354 RepID=B0EGK9_ENTDS|nr:uncharacterized protein EDI_244920 [Entamoeba dispar SAW760]EDR26341.1 hypothetical protein EDI_244920 [Entamoeba dispar SAW760]|eukprot:EDR26341.1 hypothetical protein EDI_244920 [Entamoeba dispar SAW760]
MSEPQTPRDDPKEQKQFEKDKENIKKYAKEFTRFFSYSKKKPNFNVIYSSTISGFNRKTLYKKIIGEKNIMFYFETVQGDIFGSYNELIVPEESKYGSTSINNDPHYFIFSLINKSQYGAFSMSLVNNKEKKEQTVSISQSHGLIDGVTNISSGIVNGISTGISSSVDLVTTGVTTVANGVATGINTVTHSDIVSTPRDSKKGSKKMRSLYISSTVNDDWFLETYCGFIISGNEVMFNKRLGSYYQLECEPEGFDKEDSEKVTNFIAQAKDIFIGVGQPKPVELKKMIVIQWNFDTKK